MTETFLQRTRRMRRLFLNTPSLRGWRLHFSLRLLRYFSLGSVAVVEPCSGEEDSEVSLEIHLSWLLIIFGAENNPY